MFKTYADGVDLYEAFGVYVVKGGLREVLAIPPTKGVTQNDWFEEDGVEVDFDALRLDAREFSISFAISDVSLFADFVEFLAEPVYRSLRFEYVPLTYRLRFVGGGELEAVRGLGLFSLRFAEDVGAVPPYGVMPPPRLVEADEWGVDGMALADYCEVLKGGAAAMMAAPTLKTNLRRNLQYRAGEIYDEFRATNKSREVKVPLLFTAEAFPQMWGLYCGLLGNITTPEEHILRTPYTARPLPFYYKSCAVDDYLFQRGRCMLRITLTLELIDGGGGEESTVLGVSQAGADAGYFVTHEEQYIKIER